MVRHCILHDFELARIIAATATRRTDKLMSLSRRCNCSVMLT